MSYRIIFTLRAERDLEALPDVEQERVTKRIASLARTPRPAGVKRLQGEDSIYRLRAGDYRVIYEIADRLITVTIIRIGHRRDIYR